MRCDLKKVAEVEFCYENVATKRFELFADKASMRGPSCALSRPGDWNFRFWSLGAHEMKAVILLSLICSLPISLEAKEHNEAKDHRRIVVSADGSNCPEAQFSRIQDAIDAAAPKDSIHVCRGVYEEQLRITKSLEIEANYDAILVPKQMQSNASSLTTGDRIAAVIYASSAEEIGISGLTVDATASGISSCSPRLIGIYYQNASGSLDWLRIRNVKLGPGLEGCQSGTGVFVQSGNGGKSVVEMENIFIRDYQKNGITANESGTTVLIHKNVVTGIGPTTGAAQNGIQVGFGATGTISRNLVTSNLWSPCSSVQTCQAVATNILVVESDGVSVTDNLVGHSQISIFMDGNHGLLEHNKTFLTSVFDGVRVEGNDNSVKKNKISDSAESGIYVQGNDNLIEQNTIVNAPIGILKTTDSIGNRIEDNHFLNVVVKVQDPPGTVNQIISADR
jgi:parallel beta-helix repeat protein